MSLRKTVSVRLVSSPKLCDLMIHHMVEYLKREGWQLAQQPSYRKSRKEPEDVLVYLEFIEPEF